MTVSMRTGSSNFSQSVLHIIYCATGCNKEDRERVSKIKFMTQKLQEPTAFDTNIVLDADLTQASDKRMSMGDAEAVALRERLMQQLEKTGTELSASGQCETWLADCDPWIAKVREYHQYHIIMFWSLGNTCVLSGFGYN